MRYKLALPSSGRHGVTMYVFAYTVYVYLYAEGTYVRLYVCACMHIGMPGTSGACAVLRVLGVLGV